MVAKPRPRAPADKGLSEDEGLSSAPSDVLVFVDDANISEASLQHAQNVARALGGSVEVLQVLCQPVAGDSPIDPVGWDIKKQQAQKRLDRLSQASEGADPPCRARLLEGKCFSQIKSLMELRSGDIAASTRLREMTGAGI